MRRYLLGKNKIWLILTIILQFFASITALSAAIMLRMVIDTINKKSLTALYFVVGMVIGYALLLGCITCFSQRVKEIFRKRALYELRQDLMRGILNQDIVQFQEANSASYLSMCNTNVQMIEENYIKNIIDIFTNICMITIGVIMMFLFHWMVALVALVCSLLPTLIPNLFRHRLGKAQKEMATSASVYTTSIKDIFNGFAVIKSYGMGVCVRKEHSHCAYEIEDKKAKQACLLADVTSISTGLGVLVQFIIILFAGVLVIKGYITLGTIIAITQLSGEVLGPASVLSSQIGLLKCVKPICEELLSYIDRPLEKEGQVHIPPLSKMITFTNVHFAYDGKEVIKGICIQFEKHKKYAIVGNSGSGKSTLLKLLLHYYTTYTGVISMDTHDYQHMYAEEVHKHCAFLQQSVFLFDDTIKNNITLFEDVAEETLENVIVQAGLDEMIKQFPKGMDTLVGESGNMLSGGEVQRIAIARALLKGADVLVLDEATSALDNETASYIERTILSMKEMTSIVVTHRLNEKSLALYDEILVMDQGEIVDKGSYQTLLKSSEKFKNLVYVNR